MSVYLPKVNQLKNCENTNIIEILRYIARKEGYINCSNIEFNKLYYKVILPRAKQSNINISKRQYKRMRKIYHGRFPVAANDLLLILYEILLDYKEYKPHNPVKNNITYSDYTVSYVKYVVERILRHDEAFSNVLITDDGRQLFEDFINRINELEEEVYRHNETKIYNDIW